MIIIFDDATGEFVRAVETTENHDLSGMDTLDLGRTMGFSERWNPVTRTVEYDLEKMQRLLLATVSDIRKSFTDSFVTIEPYGDFDVNAEAKINMTGQVAAMGLLQPEQLAFWEGSWTLADGHSVATFSSALEFFSVADRITTFINACHYRKRTLATAIMAAQNQLDMDAIDIFADWPEPS